MRSCPYAGPAPNKIVSFVICNTEAAEALV
jgi:hypothetical protein